MTVFTRSGVNASTAVRAGSCGYRSSMSDITTPDFGITVYSDIACPWAHVAVHRLHRAISERGVDDEIELDHRAFPLEIVNGRPTPKDILDVEVRVCADLEPEAGWSFDPHPWTYPVSTLPALEAVQAAKEQGADASAGLDRALRRSMFRDWRCLSVFAVVEEIAATVDGLDVEKLRSTIRSGNARSEIWHQLDDVEASGIPGSPTFVLPDGTTVHNPGIEFHWEDERHEHLVVDVDDRDAIADLVDLAITLRPAD